MLQNRQEIDTFFLLMKAMILAAGLGTRLKPFTDTRPKALAEVNGKTLLQRNIEYLKGFDIGDIIVNIHHFADDIEGYLTENHGFGLNIVCSDERDAVLETGGGLKRAAPFFAGEDAFVVMNADVLTDLDLGAMVAAHAESGAWATLAVTDRASSRRLLFDESGLLYGWENRETGEQRMARPIAGGGVGWAFSGVQVVSQALLQDIPFEGKFSLIDLYLYHAVQHPIGAFNHSGSLFIDVGRLESLARAATLFP